MNDKRGLAIAATAIVLLVGIVWSAAPTARAALAYRAPGLLEIFAGVAALVAISGAGLVIALRRRRTEFGWAGVALQLVFGSVSAAIGVNPGIVFLSLAGALTFGVALAVTAGLIGAVRDRGLGWIAAFGTLFAGAATAGFMVGWAPVLAMLIVRGEPP